MTRRDLSARVTRSGAALAAPIAVAAVLVGGLEALVGVLGGAGVALLGFRWLARTAAGLAASAAGRPGPATLGLGALRHVATFGALALLVGTGWAHPLGVAAGLAVLPPVLVVQGLREGTAA